jgi:simple sugar transport system substrate-binding protein
VKKRYLVFLVVLFALLPSAVLVGQAKEKYTFYHLLWDVTDPNVQWHIRGGEAFMKVNPEVQIKYVGPERYDPAEHAKFLDTILKARPDGICLHISSVDALLPGLREAKRLGIPVVSVTSHPPLASDDAKLKGLYLTWVGADEGLIGYRLGERVLEEGIKPVHVAFLLAHVGHAGMEARASGFFKSMPSGVKTDRVAIGEEPSHAKDVIRSFLRANTDVNVMFVGSAAANKWVWDVVNEMRRKITLVTADESPTSLEGVIQGKYLATFSQEFPIQAELAYEVLYLYKETHMAPVAPMITGPLVVDSSNVQEIKNMLLKFMGDDAYYKQSPW